MSKLIQKLISYTVQEQEKPFTLRLLRTILIVTLVTVVAVLISDGIFGNRPYMVYTLAALSAFLLISLFLLARGVLWPTRLLVPLSLLGVQSYLIAVSGGIHDISLIAYGIVLILASLTLGPGAPLIFGLLSIVIVVSIGLLEIQGILINQGSFITSYGELILFSILVATMAALQRILVGRLNESLRQARQSEQEQIRANQALRESEARQHALLDAIPELVFRIRRDGVFMDYHAPSTDQLIAPPEAFLGRSVGDMMPPDVADKTMRSIDQVLRTGQLVEFEYSLASGDETRNYDARMVRASRDQVLTTVRDITGRRQAEEKLVQREELYRHAIIAADAVPYYRDFITGQYTFIGEGIERITGYAAAEITPQMLVSLIEETHLQGPLAHLSPAEAIALSRSGQLNEWRCDTRLRSRTGEIRWFLDAAVHLRNEQGQHVGSIGILQDITDRKRAEEALRKSETQMRLLWESSSDGMRLTDAQGKMVMVNEAFCRIVAKPKEALEGQPLAIIYMPPIHETVQRNYVENFAARAIPPYFEGQLDLWNGQRPWYGVATSFFEVEGQSSLLLCLFRDITERKQAEAEREKLIADLEVKNAELERFTYTVSHDLKAPLVTIRGFLGFVEQAARAGNLERLQADMVRITDATDKMQRLLNELLELSRIGRMMNPPKAVSFEAIAREAMELVQGRLEARGVRVEIAPDLPMAYGDRARLVEVMQNLVDNACKFMGAQPDPRVEIGAQADADGQPIFFVRDNGIGIEPQYHERVFGLFNKLDAKTEGTGVGLALVKRIVEVHGGRIWVESDGLGCGATFCFTLTTPQVSGVTDKGERSC